MKTQSISLTNLSQLIVDYKNDNEKIMKYFSYKPFSENDEKRRLKHLQSRTFKRKELVNLLLEKNKAWDCSEQTIHNIERLKDEKSVVVIGGQQAGLLTGPLYTLNKIISIIKLAKEKEEKFNVPVIPVFWIAGEDHDYDEINHTYVLKDKLEKIAIDHLTANKKPISTIEKNQENLKSFIKKNFKYLEDTPYTKKLYEAINEMAIKAKNYVDFFAYFINYLFKDYGIVLIDSADDDLRRLESDFFVKMVQKQSDFGNVVFKAKQNLSKDGYAIDLDVDINDTHLFYTYRGERLLLTKEEGKWTDRDKIVSFTSEEILQIAKNEPEKLSNNVVSRPIMQEFLFPTFAFIGGNGEISYWSVLKEAFELFGLEMPPVLPRYSFSYVDKTIRKSLNHINLQIEDVFKGELPLKKMNWLKTQTVPPLSVLFEQLINVVEQNHAPIHEIAGEIRSDISMLAEKNLERIKKELEFLQNRMEAALKEKHVNMLKHFDFIEHTLLPFNGLQERIWSPIYLLNKFGPQFIFDLINEEIRLENDHYIVFI